MTEPVTRPGAIHAAPLGQRLAWPGQASRPEELLSRSHGPHCWREGPWGQHWGLSPQSVFLALLTFPLTVPGPKPLLRALPGSSPGSTSCSGAVAAGPGRVQLGSSLPGERPSSSSFSSSYLHLSHRNQTARSPLLQVFFFLSLWLPTSPVLSCHRCLFKQFSVDILGPGPFNQVTLPLGP